jgi:glycosyltransferase involved in cell wall biosynthesis
MTPDVTVITCIYNKGGRTKRTMESILGQTYPGWRYIVIDDGSTDNTKEILAAFSDPRIEIRHQSNRGFCASMVDAMREVTTPYVAIQGAGDNSLPDRLLLQRQHLEADPSVGAVGCAFEVVDENGKVVRSPARRALTISGPSQLYRHNVFSHGEVMLKMEAYHRAGGYRAFFTYAQDRDLWLRISKRHRLCKIPEYLYQQVVAARSDISGSPAKLLRQKQLSTFAVYLSARKLDEPELLDHNKLTSLFRGYLETASREERRQWARRVGSAIREFGVGSDPYDERFQQALAIAALLAPFSITRCDLVIRRFLQVRASRLLAVYESGAHAANVLRRSLAAKLRRS